MYFSQIPCEHRLRFQWCFLQGKRSVFAGMAVDHDREYLKQFQLVMIVYKYFTSELVLESYLCRYGIFDRLWFWRIPLFWYWLLRSMNGTIWMSEELKFLWHFVFEFLFKSSQRNSSLYIWYETIWVHEPGQ